MTDIAERFPAAQEAALRGSVALRQAMGLAVAVIFDALPENQPVPYVVIGEDQILDDSDECQNGSEIYSTVHFWSKPEPPSSAQARSMATALRAALNADLAIVGHETVLHAFEDMQFKTDPGGVTHGIIVFRYLTTPSEA